MYGQAGLEAAQSPLPFQELSTFSQKSLPLNPPTFHQSFTTLLISQNWEEGA